MASINPNAPYGFRPIRNRNGDFPLISDRTASGSVDVPTGSIAILKTDGTIASWNGSYATARRIIGPVAAGVTDDATDRTVKICEDPNVEMEVMLDDASVTGINGLVGRNFRATDLTSVSYNGTLNQSTQKLDASTGSSLNGVLSTNVRPFQGIRFSGEVGNVSSQSFARVIVRIRPENHIFGTATTTV
jgi:hypothetical protein